MKAVNFIITLSRVLRIGCEQGISHAMKAQGILPFMVSLNQTNMSSNKLSPIHHKKTSLIKACLTKAIIESLHEAGLSKPFSLFFNWIMLSFSLQNSIGNVSIRVS